MKPVDQVSDDKFYPSSFEKEIWEGGSLEI